VTQHHQDNQPTAGEQADGRIKKPRHKKFQTQSYGERMAAEAATTPTGEVRNDAARGDRRALDVDFAVRSSRGARRVLPAGLASLLMRFPRSRPSRRALLCRAMKVAP